MGKSGAPDREEAGMSLLRRVIGGVLRRIRLRQGRTLREVAQAAGVSLPTAAASVEMRYRYNQAFRSLDAMVPAVIGLLLVFIPAILAALGVVREKELGSITNLYVTPVT